MKHWGSDELENVTISDIYAARKVYKALLMAAVDTGHDIQRVILRNPQGEILAQCSF